MKKFLALLIASFLLFSSCGETQAPSPEPTPDPLPDLVTENKIYTIFTLNVHDWVYPEDSAETMHRVIDIHEKYNTPLDIFVTDPVFQYYVEEDPELVERFKSSEVVCISHHSRPSSPYYTGFDYVGLAEMSGAELHKTLTDYTEHKLDLSTGEFLDEPGGYQFIADTIGYPPLITGISTMGAIGSALAEVYRERGAKFLVVHGQEIDLGDTRFDTYVRPEHKEVKLYEWVRSHEGGEDVFETATADLTGTGLEFINLKYHENNFYLTGTPFWPVYWTDSDKAETLEPPFDTSISKDTPKHRSQDLQDAHWALYEATVKYASEHADELNPINAFDLEEMI